MLRLVVAQFCLCAVLVLLSACDDAERNESLLLLSRYEMLDTEGPIEERRSALERLHSLPLVTARALQVRDTCWGAYNSVMMAEEHHAAAVQSFMAASQGGGAPVTETERGRIDSLIGDSNRALERGRTLITECDRLVRSLRARYQPQRRRE